jgi:hypothetical protein
MMHKRRKGVKQIQLTMTIGEIKYLVEIKNDTFMRVYRTEGEEVCS